MDLFKFVCIYNLFILIIFLNYFVLLSTIFIKPIKREMTARQLFISHCCLESVLLLIMFTAQFSSSFVLLAYFVSCI
jgi:hypothetical protein